MLQRPREKLPPQISTFPRPPLFFCSRFFVMENTEIIYRETNDYKKNFAYYGSTNTAMKYAQTQSNINKTDTHKCRFQIFVWQAKWDKNYFFKKCVLKAFSLLAYPIKLCLPRVVQLLCEHQTPVADLRGESIHNMSSLLRLLLYINVVTE